MIEEARRLTERGYAEIALTGVDLTAYGADLPGTPTLGQLVRKLLRLVPALARLRLSSLDSVEADRELWRAIAGEERLMPHFHLSAQSGDDMILKRMKRRHSRRDTIAFCEEVRRLRPEASFGADLIAGFPTESDSMFENTLRLVEDASLSFLHVFPFSPRKGTPAARMPQLPRAVVKTRAARLRAKGRDALENRLRTLVGSRQSILVEQQGRGRTNCYAPVRLAATAAAGEILAVRITSAAADHLTAEFAA